MSNTSIGRFRLSVHPDHGRCKMILSDDDRTIGMASMTWADYQDICRGMALRVLSSSAKAIQNRLGQELWEAARRAACLESALVEPEEETAKARLLQLGLTPDVVGQIVDALAREIAQGFLDLMPSVSP